MTNPKDSYEPTPIIVCGNKCDLDGDRKVSKAKGQKLADKEMAFGFYETSAKTGQNVHTLFQTLAYHITDICHPKLMKSYHPYQIRLISKPHTALTQPERLRQFKGKKKGKGKSPKKKGKAAVVLDPSKVAATYSKYGLENVPTKDSVTKNGGQKFFSDKNGTLSKTKHEVIKKKDKSKDRSGSRQKKSGFRWCACFGR